MTHTLGRPDLTSSPAGSNPATACSTLAAATAPAQAPDRYARRAWLGVEIDDANILAAIKNGINVIQGNLENGLDEFADQSFDHVVLSRTLQTVRHTEGILREMLRVGREAVVSFPNFAYWKNLRSVLDGRMPVSEDLPYQWYDSPNVRFFTLLDFEALCAQMGLIIRERHVLDEEGNMVQRRRARTQFPRQPGGLSPDPKPLMPAWLAALLNRKMLICIFTGFSSGLPLYLLLNLLPAWLRSEGVDLKTIGFFALIQFPYTWKFLWSPLLDRFSLPGFGRRRGWMLVTQIGLLLAIGFLGGLDPKETSGPSCGWRLFAALGNAGHRCRCLPPGNPERPRTGPRQCRALTPIALPAWSPARCR
jgi:methionine biosynthesis protein MetW